MQEAQNTKVIQVSWRSWTTTSPSRGRIVPFQEFLDVAQYNAAWAVAAVR